MKNFTNNTAESANQEEHQPNSTSPTSSATQKRSSLSLPISQASSTFSPPAGASGSEAPEVFEIESAFERRIGDKGVVEYLIKLRNIDKFEWVPASAIYCPELMTKVGESFLIPEGQQTIDKKEEGGDEESPNSGFKTMASKNIVQYIIVRGDLKWPTGALIGQGCHAAVAAIASTATQPDTLAYLAELSSMTKLVLKADSEEQILEASKSLTDAGIDHYLWREQPENIISAMATSPKNRDLLKPHLTAFKLFR